MTLSEKAEAFIRRCWASPTLTTWSSLAARLGGAIVLLPLVLSRFSEEEVGLWLLLAAIATLQVVGDAGFSQTFTRALSNARGGARIADLIRISVKAEGSPPALSPPARNDELLSRILSAMRPIYLRLSLVSFVLLLAGGGYAIYPAVMRAPSVNDAWMAAAMTLAATTVAVWGNVYASYLQGMERVAVLRRWETLFAILGVGSAAGTILLGGGLLEVVIAQQLWVIFSVLRNRWLCVRDALFSESYRGAPDREVIQSLWPAAWRSGIGVLLGFGIIQASGPIYARFASSSELATYLLGLRIILLISQLSQAPFYSRIPEFARLCAERKRDALVKAAARSMRLSHIVFCLGFVSAGFLADPLLELIGSNARFPEATLWTLLGLAFFAERTGAMHLQLYSVTNHIVWHIANGLTGLTMIFLGVSLYGHIGILAFPAAMLASYVVIYCSISCTLSYRAFGLTFGAMDARTTLPPLVVAAVLWVAMILR
jgi:hypothetical protein